MHRINLDDLIKLSTRGILLDDHVEKTSDVNWDTAMLVAHVEHDDGTEPEMRMLRTAIQGNHMHRVFVDCPETSQPVESLVAFDGNELVVSLARRDEADGVSDASVIVSCTLENPCLFIAHSFDHLPLPAMVLHHDESDAVEVLLQDGDSVELPAGRWLLSSTPKANGALHAGLFEFHAML